MLSILVGIIIGFIIFLVFTEVKEMIILSLPRKRNDDIKTLIRQTARWTIASRQDISPIVAVLHINYGVGYLSALTDIAKPNEIEKITGINFDKFKKEIYLTQDIITKRLAKICPNYAPISSYLGNISGEK